jgi:hypothetical protein
MQIRHRVLICIFSVAPFLSAQDNLKTTLTQRYFDVVRENLEGAASVMPAAKFGYKLTDAQMSFAEWLNHSTDRNYRDCAAIKFEAAPEALKKVSSLREKPEVSQALKDSFAYCAAALQTLDTQKVLANPQATYSLLHLVVHNNEIYGNIVGYLRSNGIVPPSTAGRMNQKKK